MPLQINAIAQLLETGVDKYCHAAMTFSNGAAATSSTGMILDEVETYRIDRYFLEGEEGRIEILVQYNGAGVQSYDIIQGVNRKTINFEVPNNFALEIDQFSKCVRGIEQPLVSNELSYRIALVQDEILKKLGTNDFYK